jgi:hypothetical protein
MGSRAVDVILATLMIIPMEFGLMLGMIGMLPAAPAMAGKPPSNRGQLALISCAVIIGAVGMSAGLAHLMLGTTI